MWRYKGEFVDWKWCGRCYGFEGIYAFGFCKDCWIKYGKPNAME